PSTALTRTRYDPDDLNVVNDANYIGSEEQLEEQTEIEYLAGQEVDEDSSNTEQELTAGQVKEDESLEDTADLTPELIYNSLREDWMDLYGAAQVSTDDTNEADSSTVSNSQADDTANDASSAAGGSTDDSANASGGGQGDGSTLNEEEENGLVQDNNVPVDPTEEENESENDGGDNDENKKDEIIDPNGETKTVISGEGKVAAVGEAATLVCMLAGVDRLCATSESQTTGTLLQQAFPIDEEECAVLWSGDGSSSALDDEDFATLLEIGPDAVFYLSGTNTFTRDQIDQLDEAGIGHYPLDFTTLDGIETAVEVV
ncbi:MAG: hypothetical protein LUB63_06375, partial [Oscillospiraceae bacterium]|nr:hypothetical protein [Oscillospiraceae bacterium]